MREFLEVEMKKLGGIVLLAVVGLSLLGTFGSGAVDAAATSKQLSTLYTVQNLGNATANVQVAYNRAYDGVTPGGAWTPSVFTTFTITVGASKVIRQYSDTLPAGSGSAVLSSDQPIAAITNILARNQTPTSGSYSGFDQGAPVSFAPFVFKNQVSSVGTINSQLIIMNVGAAATNVTVDLISAATGGISVTKSIANLPAGESYYYDQSTESALPDNWQGSAKVTATSGSVAVVGNQFTGADGLLTYTGFAAGYTDWSVPFFFSRLSNGYNSVVAIQNVSGGALAVGSVNFVYQPTAVPSSWVTLTNPTQLNNNATWIVNPRGNAAFPVGSQGPVKISATGNVVAIVNQLKNETTATTSPSAMSYNAIPTNLTGRKVMAPFIASRLSNGYSTVFAVANLTGIAGTCDFTYTPDGSILPAGGSILHNHRNAVLPPNWQGSVSATCTQPVGGFVNEIQNGGTGDPDMSYNAFTVN
jgi:hypothetical protein